MKYLHGNLSMYHNIHYKYHVLHHHTYRAPSTSIVQDGAIKGRAVDGGNKQRDYTSKKDAISPSVATEAVLLSCIIDAYKERDFAVIDIPNAFIQTQVEDEKDMAFIKICGFFVDILVEISSDVYKSHITKDKTGVKQLLVQFHIVLYDTTVAGLLYYCNFKKS